LLQEEDSAEDTDQVRETGKTSRTVEVLLSEGWHRAFNNNSIRPALLSTDNNSLYSKSVHGLGDEARSIRLFNKADSID
jgi:hypothetical protein